MRQDALARVCMTGWILVSSTIILLSLASCGKKDHASAGVPEVQPPVDRATPAGLKTSGIAAPDGMVSAFTLDPSQIVSRFYSAGPTKIDNLLADIDGRMKEINTRSTEDDHACLSATPVAQSIVVGGETQTAYFQCYDVFSDGTGGMLFGKKDDVWYLFTNVGAGRTFSVVTPVTGSAGEYVVDGWFSVGQTNAGNWYSGSYGLIHLKANSATKALELTVAGTGFGYCGAQLLTDGTNVFVKGSASGGTSDGTAWTCPVVDEACRSAASITTAGTCTAVDASHFALNPLGVTGKSTYGTNVTLDGTATDSVHFGYSVAQMQAIAGVSKF